MPLNSRSPKTAPCLTFCSLPLDSFASFFSLPTRLDKEINGSADDGTTRHLHSPDAAGPNGAKRIPPGVAYINAGEEDQMVSYFSFFPTMPNRIPHPASGANFGIASAPWRPPKNPISLLTFNHESWKVPFLLLFTILDWSCETLKSRPGTAPIVQLWDVLNYSGWFISLTQPFHFIRKYTATGDPWSEPS